MGPLEDTPVGSPLEGVRKVGPLEGSLVVDPLVVFPAVGPVEVVCSRWSLGGLPVQVGPLEGSYVSSTRDVFHWRESPCRWCTLLHPWKGPLKLLPWTMSLE